MTKQYTLNNNILEMKVNKAPLFVRLTLFIFSFLFFLMPLTGMIVGIVNGNSLHLSYFFGIFLFGILGFYLLRISLWNTYGKEVITFEAKSIIYYADYGWFKDGKKQIPINSNVELLMTQIGYNDDNRAVLTVESQESLMCVTKIPITELEEMISKLNNVLANKY